MDKNELEQLVQELQEKNKVLEQENQQLKNDIGILIGDIKLIASQVKVTLSELGLYNLETDQLEATTRRLIQAAGKVTRMITSGNVAGFTELQDLIKYLAKYQNLLETPKEPKQN